MLPLVHPPASFDLREVDAVELLHSVPPRSIDCIITDPAYDTLEEHRARGTTTRLTNQWFDVFERARYPTLFAAFERALKNDAHLYVMCDWRTLFEIEPSANAAGFELAKPIVWDKVKIGMGYNYRSRYEFVAFFKKRAHDSRRLADLGVPDVVTIPSLRGDGLYPTQKPVELFEVFVRQSAHIGERVCDPFMGSGACGAAAIRNGRSFLGGDTSADAVRLAARTIKGELS